MVFNIFLHIFVLIMAIAQIYILTHNYESENVNKDSFSKRKFFEKGDRVTGDYYYKTNILVEGKYPIPLDCLKMSSPNDKVQEKKEKKYPINSPFYSKSTKERSKVLTLGSGIGGLLGFLTASYFGKNKLVFSIGGFLAGLYIQNYLTKKESVSNIINSHQNSISIKEENE